MKFMKVTTDDTDEAVDIPTMRAMSDDQYKAYVTSNLLWMDHHEILRSVIGQYPIATTERQIEILIDHLRDFSRRMNDARG